MHTPLPANTTLTSKASSEKLVILFNLCKKKAKTQQALMDEKKKRRVKKGWVAKGSLNDTALFICTLLNKKACYQLTASCYAQMLNDSDPNPQAAEPRTCSLKTSSKCSIWSCSAEGKMWQISSSSAMGMFPAIGWQCLVQTADNPVRQKIIFI